MARAVAVYTLILTLFEFVIPAPAAQAAVPWLHTSGNQIYNSSGVAWYAHGVNLPDTLENGRCSYASGQAYNPNEQIRRLNIAKSWGANLIRLDLDSSQAFTAGSSGLCSGGYSVSNASYVTNDSTYLSAIKAIVDQAATNGQYVIVSVWQDPSFTCKDGDPGWEPTADTNAVWRTIVGEFAAYSNVIFGLANEPHANDGNDIDGTVWSDMNFGLQIIRDQEGKSGAPHPHLVSVQGSGYSGTASYWAGHPLTGSPPSSNGNNVVYEVHMYSNNAGGYWNTTIFTPAQQVPVVVGEYGPGTVVSGDSNNWVCGGGGATVTNGMQISDIVTFQTQLRQNGIPYMAWSFDEEDSPSMLLPGGSCGSTFCNEAITIDPSHLSDWGTLVYNDLIKGWLSPALIIAATSP